MIAPGLHVISRRALLLPTLLRESTSMGVLDVLRMIEGFLPEPPPGLPLRVLGTEALIDAADDRAAVLHAIRSSLVAARGYFGWSRIPIIFEFDGRLEASPSGLELVRPFRRVSLTPLVGTRVEPVGDSPDTEWWHSDQLG